MEITQTERGFDYSEFIDRYDTKCSLQKSSLATEDCIWLGVAKIEPKIMAVHAPKYGLKTDEDTGWIEYPIPVDVLLSSRMHLTRDMVKELLPLLQKFVDTGDIE